MSVTVQQDATIYSFYYISADSSTCFWWYPHPSSGAHSNCNYNIWHWSICISYHPLTWRSWNNSSTSADSSKYGSTSARCCTWCVTKVMTLNAWLDNWQCCSHTSDTSWDIRSYLMISASFNSIALTRVIWQRVV